MSLAVLASRLPPAPGNVFQRIKAIRKSAEERGINIHSLGIGQPSGAALLSARLAAAAAVQSDQESMHEYQDNGSPGVPNFAQRFVQHHVESDLAQFENLGYLPTPGLKPMLKLIPLACGASKELTITVATMTDPGYATPAVWCKIFPGIEHRAIHLCPENDFLFGSDDLNALGIRPGGLIMLNFPHNPSGKAASEECLRQLCSYAENNNIRIWNDAAYAVLAHNDVHTTLTDVAVDFPYLSWAEGFSASKAIQNGTGWRVGAIVGSADFVSDIARFKGEDDSGFCAFAAAGIIEAFDNDRKSIDGCRDIYAKRIEILIEALQSWGMRLAVRPDAGFFTLWMAPRKAFGQEVKNAEHFNQLMIENTGVLGVPFHPYIRYAVTGDIKRMLSNISAGCEKAAVQY